MFFSSGAIKKNVELTHHTDDKTYLPLLRKCVLISLFLILLNIRKLINALTASHSKMCFILKFVWCFCFNKYKYYYYFRPDMIKCLSFHWTVHLMIVSRIKCTGIWCFFILDTFLKHWMNLNLISLHIMLVSWLLYGFVIVSDNWYWYCLSLTEQNLI